MAIQGEKDRDDAIKVIGFLVGKILLGADIMTIREILRQPAVEPVKAVDHRLKGVVRLRGEVIPVVDLADCVRYPLSETKGERAWMLIAHSEKAPIGYLVDSVTRILRVKSGEIMPPPGMPAADSQGRYIHGVCETEKGLLVVVHLDRIIEGSERETMLKAARG